MNGGYSKFLTIFLIIIVVGILSVGGYLGYNYYKEWKIENGASKIVDEFKQVTHVKNKNEVIIVDVTSDNNTTEPETSDEVYQYTPITYENEDVIGLIEIPAIGIEYPVLATATARALNISVAYLYGPGLNKVGNTVIAGHNYRNGTLFSKNKRLEIGDVIFITDTAGAVVRYVIYDKYITNTRDSAYLTRDTGGTREISLKTCTDDAIDNLIICAREE